MPTNRTIRASLWGGSTFLGYLLWEDGGRQRLDNQNNSGRLGVRWQPLAIFKVPAQTAIAQARLSTKSHSHILWLREPSLVLISIETVQQRPTTL